MTSSQRLEFDVLVIGAGLVGSSTAMHLAELGAKSVAVLDADLAGRLSSSELNAGGARATWDQPINAELARDSIRYLKQHKDEVGFRECGYLWMHSPQQWEGAIARAERLSKRYDLGIEKLSVQQLQERLPFIDKTDDLAGATLSPQDGLFNPNLLKLQMRDRAKAKGVEFLEGHRVHAIRATDAKVEVDCHRVPPKNEGELKDFYERAPEDDPKNPEQRTLKGKILVNCAGPWAARIASLYGEKAHTKAVRRQVSIFDCREVDISHYGMMVDTSGVYFHPEATNILGGFADHNEPYAYNLDYDGQTFFEEKIWMPLYNRSSKFEQLKHITGWGGLYEVTPDMTAVLGHVPGRKNIFENHGYSGRGAMQSYAAGRGLAELIQTGKFQTLDLSSLTGERFATGKLVPEGLLI